MSLFVAHSRYFLLRVARGHLAHPLGTADATALTWTRASQHSSGCARFLFDSNVNRCSPKRSYHPRKLRRTRRKSACAIEVGRKNEINARKVRRSFFPPSSLSSGSCKPRRRRCFPTTRSCRRPGEAAAISRFGERHSPRRPCKTTLGVLRLRTRRSHFLSPRLPAHTHKRRLSPLEDRPRRRRHSSQHVTSRLVAPSVGVK